MMKWFTVMCSISICMDACVFSVLIYMCALIKISDYCDIYACSDIKLDTFDGLDIIDFSFSKRINVLTK
jgi:hypothetical protein